MPVRRDRIPLGGVLWITTRSSGRTSSISFHNSVGTPADIDQAQKWVVRGTGDLVALRRAHGVGLVLAGVEQAIGDNWVTVPVQEP